MEIRGIKFCGSDSCPVHKQAPSTYLFYFKHFEIGKLLVDIYITESNSEVEI